MNITAQVDYSAVDGPVVSIDINGITVSVYIASETGVVKTDYGQHGIEVTGPWFLFREGIKKTMKERLT